jgi:predicted kinase
VVDGTGTKLTRRVQRMRDASVAGWWVKLLVVAVSLRTAAERNARRHRRVPPHVLSRYQAELDLSAATQSIHADEVEVRVLLSFACPIICFCAG